VTRGKAKADEAKAATAKDFMTVGAVGGRENCWWSLVKAADQWEVLEKEENNRVLEGRLYNKFGGYGPWETGLWTRSQIKYSERC
jgi:hypothetical protein